MAGDLWREMRSAMGGAPWFRSQLFVLAISLAVQRTGGFWEVMLRDQHVGPVGTLGTAHYDQYDNVFLQVRGRKRILLFEPRAGYRGLRPFPVHHPYDMRARNDPEKDFRGKDQPGLELLQGCGYVADLLPGDALYIPSHWWHHVTAVPQRENSSSSRESSSAGWCISVNFWFDTVTGALLRPSYPFGSHLEVELARQVEYLVADTFGASAVAAFMARCKRHLDSNDEESLGSPGEEDIAELAVRNYVLRSVALALGPSSVRLFIEDYLHPRRWEDLPRNCF
ncbi:unnamed protein product [Polarella glacialis]|uniref:JmjC domain-containing protein n=1 Tax=Polarella glacialis TaxID=89957 RepID=A0A813L735_POLGL|nr:unnamed protein product [Polarella glacialis]